MILRRVTEPVTEPLTIAEIMAHLRLGAEHLEPIPGAPSIALAGVGAGNVTNGDHRYRLTFVTADGETNGGDISAAVTINDRTVDGRTTLTNLAIGGTAVLRRNVYRTKSGNDDFFLVATINDNSTTTFEDNVADEMLGVGCPSTNTTLDGQLMRFIKTAREDAEQYLNKALIDQTWRCTLDAFPDTDAIVLDMPPLRSVMHVKYYDASNQLVTLDVNDYYVDTESEPGRVIVKASWPATYARWDAVQIEFVAGYGATPAAIPELYRAGMKLLVSDYNDNREPMNIGNIVNELPAVKRCFRDRYVKVY